MLFLVQAPLQHLLPLTSSSLPRPFAATHSDVSSTNDTNILTSSKPLPLVIIRFEAYLGWLLPFVSYSLCSISRRYRSSHIRGAGGSAVALRFPQYVVRRDYPRCRLWC